jgi:predicted ATPase
LHKSAEQAAGSRVEARVEAVVGQLEGRAELRYGLAFEDVAGRLEITDEYLENAYPAPGKEQPYFFYRWNGGHPLLNTAGGQGGPRGLKRESIKPDQSILAQRRDSDLYPELTQLAETLADLRLYRDWTFGRSANVRRPQQTDLPNDRLLPDASNLALVISRVKRDGAARRRLIDGLKRIFEGVEDVEVGIEAGSAQLFLVEAAGSMPATRLSDGTLRYLFLLTLLCDPNPPPLLVIEEPELGLHPDLLPSLAEMLVEASQRTQIIVTTHAPSLVDALTDQPESVVVCERRDGGATYMERLEADHLAPWLEKFRLGQLWISGEIGGTRW